MTEHTGVEDPSTTAKLQARRFNMALSILIEPHLRGGGHVLCKADTTGGDLALYKNNIFITTGFPSMNAFIISLSIYLSIYPAATKRPTPTHSPRASLPRHAASVRDLVFAPAFGNTSAALV